MRSLLVFIVLLGLFYSCKKQVATPNSEGEEKEEFIRFQDFAPKVKVNNEVGILISEWAEFNDFDRSFDLMYRSNNYEELLLAVDDLLEKEKALSQSVYPEAFDIFQTKSRQKVIRTFLLKTRASVLDKTDTKIPIEQMITSYNALRNQLNTIVVNKLDLNQIFENEEIIDSLTIK